MPKTIHRDDYGLILALLKKARLRAGLTQYQCALALGRHQSFISDVERGKLRLDVVQLRDLCGVLHTDLIQFVKALEREIKRRTAQ